MNIGPADERAILGALVLDPEFNLPKVRQAGLCEQSFTDRRNAVIWRQIQAICEKKPDELDTVSLSDAIATENQVGPFGGLSEMTAYVDSIASGVPRSLINDYWLRAIQSKTALRRMLATAKQLVSEAGQSGADPSELIPKYRLAFDNMRVNQSAVVFKTPADLQPQMLAELTTPHCTKPGYLTGLNSIDGAGPRIQKQELIIIAARPGAGKSTLALQVASFIAENYGPTVFFSLEMTAEEQLMRLTSSRTGIALRGFINRDLTSSQTQLVTEIFKDSPPPIYFSDDFVTSAQKIVDQTKSLLDSGTQIAAVFIDYLQLIQSVSGKVSQNRNDELTEIMRLFKLSTKRLGCPFFVLSQLNRDNQKGGKGGQAREPQLSDLRGSGSIEQDSDRVWLLHPQHDSARPDDDDRPKLTQIHQAKCRNGKRFKSKIALNGAFMRFDSVDIKLWEEDDF